MPIYEYRCQHCGLKFEKLVRMQSAETPECPQCGHREVRMELSVFAAITRSPAPACARPGCAELGCPQAEACSCN